MYHELTGDGAFESILTHHMEKFLRPLSKIDSKSSIYRLVPAHDQPAPSMKVTLRRAVYVRDKWAEYLMATAGVQSTDLFESRHHLLRFAEVMLQKMDEERRDDERVGEDFAEIELERLRKRFVEMEIKKKQAAVGRMGFGP